MKRVLERLRQIGPHPVLLVRYVAHHVGTRVHLRRLRRSYDTLVAARARGRDAPHAVRGAGERRGAPGRAAPGRRPDPPRGGRGDAARGRPTRFRPGRARRRDRLAPRLQERVRLAARLLPGRRRHPARRRERREGAVGAEPRAPPAHARPRGAALARRGVRRRARAPAPRMARREPDRDGHQLDEPDGGGDPRRELGLGDRDGRGAETARPGPARGRDPVAPGARPARRREPRGIALAAEQPLPRGRRRARRPRLLPRGRRCGPPVAGQRPDGARARDHDPGLSGGPRLRGLAPVPRARPGALPRRPPRVPLGGSAPLGGLRRAAARDARRDAGGAAPGRAPAADRGRRQRPDPPRRDGEAGDGRPSALARRRASSGRRRRSTGPPTRRSRGRSGSRAGRPSEPRRARRAPARTSFPEGGHLRPARTTALHAVVRCGDVGQNGNGGHAHNDALSFELSLDGVRCCSTRDLRLHVRPGGAERVPRDRRAQHRRRRGRGDQPDRPDAALRARAGLDAEGDPRRGRAPRRRARRVPPPRHAHGPPAAASRSTPRRLVVEDELRGTGRQVADAYLHLAPGAVVAAEGDGRYAIADGDRPAAVLSIRGADSVAVESGWVSSSFGSREPAPVLRARLEGDLPLRLTCEIESVEGEA